jgi:hypothetical protein
MTTQPKQDSPETIHPNPVKHHWIITVRTADGRQATRDGRIDVVPGIHTHEGSFQTVRNLVEEWLGTDELTVVFFNLTPNQL